MDLPAAGIALRHCVSPRAACVRALEDLKLLTSSFPCSGPTESASRVFGAIALKQSCELGARLPCCAQQDVYACRTYLSSHVRLTLGSEPGVSRRTRPRVTEPGTLSTPRPSYSLETCACVCRRCSSLSTDGASCGTAADRPSTTRLTWATPGESGAVPPVPQLVKCWGVGGVAPGPVVSCSRVGLGTQILMI